MPSAASTHPRRARCALDLEVEQIDILHARLKVFS